MIIESDYSSPSLASASERQRNVPVKYVVPATFVGSSPTSPTSKSSGSLSFRVAGEIGITLAF